MFKSRRFYSVQIVSIPEYYALLIVIETSMIVLTLSHDLNHNVAVLLTQADRCPHPYSKTS